MNTREEMMLNTFMQFILNNMGTAGKAHDPRDTRMLLEVGEVLHDLMKGEYQDDGCAS